jgi:hypothetical protein
MATFSLLGAILAEHTTPYAPLPIALMGVYRSSISNTVRHNTHAALPGIEHSLRTCKARHDACGRDKPRWQGKAHERCTY